MMKRERWQGLSRTGAKLEPEELKAGWHYCEEFDLDLTRGDYAGKGTKCCWCGFDGNQVKASDEASTAP